MSYNSDSFETIVLKDLKILVSVINKHAADYIGYGKPTKLGVVPPVVIDLSEGRGIEGVLEGDWLRVTAIKLEGEGSGWGFELLKKLLASSTGEFVAFIVWEGGDSYTLLKAKDGTVEHKPIDIKAAIRAYLKEQR